jgi:hypothetical protein
MILILSPNNFRFFLFLADKVANPLKNHAFHGQHQTRGEIGLSHQY